MDQDFEGLYAEAAEEEANIGGNYIGTVEEILGKRPEDEIKLSTDLLATPYAIIRNARVIGINMIPQKKQDEFPKLRKVFVGLDGIVCTRPELITEEDRK